MPKLIPGKFVWFELLTRDAKKAQAFYGEVLGWSVRAFPMGRASYDMIYVGDTMIGGYSAPQNDSQRSQWISYVSVEDVDQTAKAATAAGGQLLEAPNDIPSAGRVARIADPQGAEISPFTKATDDPPDADATQGHFFWNELHTTDPNRALAFYEKVLGFSHRAMDMGPGGTYHVLSRGGVDRGGVTSHLPAGVPPHWLPYVYVDDPDGTLSRAKKLGATIPVGPEDIPGIGRFGVVLDPGGAALAVMKPMPRAK